MGDLYFLRSNGERVLVKSSIPQSEVMQEIRDYVKKINPKFKIYYTRYWTYEPGKTRYDVGSHVEFFDFVEALT